MGRGEAPRRPRLLLQGSGGGSGAAGVGEPGGTRGRAGCEGSGTGADKAPAKVVSDTRRLSDVEWFRDVYGDVVQTVRVVATEETRKRRNWVFVAGERSPH